MNFPRYWAKGTYTGRNRDGKEIRVEAFGWSSKSVDDARALGAERARKVVEQGIGTGKKSDYEYGSAPFREEVIESIELEGREIGVVSRNRYGALVLNSASVMFVDIDFPEHVSSGLLDSILEAFSRQKRMAKESVLRENTLGKIEKWANENPSKSFRLYRTHSGFRVLLTDSVYDPGSAEAKRLLSELDSDHLYRSLTERQRCFRARLTPKPWRCGAARPPSSFPWEDPARESTYRSWENDYHNASKEFATCRLEKECGAPCEIPEVIRIIEYHDALSLNDSKPLA